MKRLKLKYLLIVILAGIIVSACNEAPTPSLYDPDVPSGQTPEVISVEPSGGALAGVTKITVTGKNFSSDKSKNFVFFNGKKGVIEEAYQDRLVVVSPIVIGDSVMVKVSVSGAVMLSNIVKYKLSPAISEILKSNGEKLFTDLMVPYSIASDASGNLYVSVSGTEPGIKKVTPGGDLSNFAPKGAETFWNSLKVGPSNIIYGSKGIRGVWEITENTVPPNSPWVATPTGSRVIDSDFDAALNLWAVGNNTTIFKIKQNKDLVQYPFTANLRTVRVFDNALYVGGLQGSTEGVWKFTIDNEHNIGSPELFFNLTELSAAAKVNAITFSADGDMYVGTNRETDAIIIVHPDKSSESLYPGVIAAKTDISTFSWFPGEFLYFSRSATLDSEGSVLLAPTVFKLNMQKTGAPYYGR
jgi:hypothetical protein